MARNVEIKARLHDMERSRGLVAAIADRGHETLAQTDTFFRVDAGRLKLREINDGHAELIYYARPDAPGPKESIYQRESVSDARTMRELLENTFGILGRVRKSRQVFWVGRTRVHLDEVDGLGNFLELEVVLKDHEPVGAGVSEANRLMERLEIDAASLIPDAYIDLLRRDVTTAQT